MTDAHWQTLRESCTRLIRAAGYTGAGTVEFMYDPHTESFAFLEVNARLQVEHPVTEMITGVDLVQWQIRIAQGEPLALAPALMNGDRTAIRGHAIECRIVAEDPSKGFMPSIGYLRGWAAPVGPGIRFDTGFGPGREVTRYYDSLIAKLIGYGATRDEAVSRTVHALHDTHILGVATNVAYLGDVLRHPGFLAGDIDTGFLGRQFADWQPPTEWPEELGALVQAASQTHTPTAAAEGGRTPMSPAWDRADGFRSLRTQ